MNELEVFKALSNTTRLQILHWLREPEKHFPPQEQCFDQVGVCVGQIQQKCGLTQSTVSEYLSLLQRAGLITATRKGQWTYYKRNDEAFDALGKFVQSTL